MSVFLAIEGADGAGKATASAAVADLLRANGKRAAVVSFPRYGDTIGGHMLGELLSGRLPRGATPESAAVLYALDRFESRAHVGDVAAANDVVVFDRYVASNMAYQAAKVGSDEADRLMRWILALETGAFGLRPPDLSVYLDTPPARALDQILQKRRRSYTDRALDENEADARLQLAVRTAYRSMVARSIAGRWITVATMAGDAMRTPAAIAEEIVAAIS
ncbi:thymidylate kinase [Sphingomonas bacterium]|uniref:thymidylate kinase n=1 Tax=Sphingomonas bacterium TaxID=1895847 RepID=UPI0015750999|nr:thymidylate kinase [Sphingomonas bacterium]